MGLLKTLVVDGQMRATVTPRLITWIYRGCLVGIGLVTLWWLLVAWMLLSWRGWWLWGLLLLFAAPLIGLTLLLCVRVGCEAAMVRFRPGGAETHAEDGAARGSGETYDGRTSPPDAVESAPLGGKTVASDGDGDADAAPPHDDPAEPDDGSEIRPVWFAALAGGVVLVALVGLTLIVATSGGDEDGGGPRAAASPSQGPATAPAPAVPPTAPPPASSSATPTAPASTAPAVLVERWRGTLTLNGSRTRRDLDTVPPRTSTRDGEPDIRGDWLKTLVEAESGALVAVVEPGSRPGAVACQDAAAMGVDETRPVDTGDVVCVLTARGTVARLVITDASQTSTAPTITADAVVWGVP